MKGWIDLETAADRLAQRSRLKAFRALSKRDARKLFRELRDMIVAGVVTAQVEGDRKRYRQLTASDALSLPFGIHFDLDGSVAAETIFQPGELRPVLVREADVDTALAPPMAATTVHFFTRADLKTRGITYTNPRLIELERQNKFPKRRYLSPTRVVWVESEIAAWIAEKLNKV